MLLDEGLLKIFLRSSDRGQNSAAKIYSSLERISARHEIELYFTIMTVPDGQTKRKLFEDISEQTFGGGRYILKLCHNLPLDFSDDLMCCCVPFSLKRVSFVHRN